MQIQDLLPKGVALETLPEAHQANLARLAAAITALEAALGFPVTCDSGYRTAESNAAIYAEKNKERLAAGNPPIPVAIHSAHLSGLAADLADVDEKLKHWILDHLEYSEDHGLYYEAFDYTKNWVHVQLRVPGSGNRFFIPY